MFDPSMFADDISSVSLMGKTGVHNLLISKAGDHLKITALENAGEDHGFSDQECH